MTEFVRVLISYGLITAEEVATLIKDCEIGGTLIAIAITLGNMRRHYIREKLKEETGNNAAYIVLNEVRNIVRNTRK